MALHGQRVAQQQVAHVHEETLHATELVELVCFPEHILCPSSAHRRLTACFQLIISLFGTQLNFMVACNQSLLKTARFLK